MGKVEPRFAFAFVRAANVVRRFLDRDDGVIMVEWVALAAGLAIGAIAIGYIVMHGLATPASNIATQLGG